MGFGRRSPLQVLAMAIAIVFLGISGRLFLGRAPNLVPSPGTPGAKSAERRALAGAQVPAASGPDAPPSSRTSLPPEAAGVPAAGKTEALPARLRRFRDTVRAARREGAKPELLLQMEKESTSLRPEVFAHPQEYLAFLRDPENEGILGDLLNIAYSRDHYSLSGAQVVMAYGQVEPSEIPKEIRAGVEALLDHGTIAQRRAALDIMPVFADGKPDPALMDRCVRLLGEEKDTMMLVHAMNILASAPERIKDCVESLAGVIEQCDALVRAGDRTVDPFVLYLLKDRCLVALISSKSEGADQLLYTTLEAAVQKSDADSLKMISGAFKENPSPLAIDEIERYQSLLAGAVGNTADPSALQSLLELSLYLPPKRAALILEQALGRTADGQLKGNILETLKRLRSGDRAIDSLRQTLVGSK